MFNGSQVKKRTKRQQRQRWQLFAMNTLKNTSRNQINELLNDFFVPLQVQKLNTVRFSPTHADGTNVLCKSPTSSYLTAV
jgi:hypothetical protein